MSAAEPVFFVWLEPRPGLTLTFRWRKGEPLLYVFRGREERGEVEGGNHLLETVPVNPQMTDVADVRREAYRWLQQAQGRQDRQGRPAPVGQHEHRSSTEQ